MTITRIIRISVALFALFANFDASYAQQAPLVPCCGIKNGVWVVLKTGKPASAAQIQSMQSSGTMKADAPKTGGATGSSNPGSSGGGGGHK